MSRPASTPRRRIRSRPPPRLSGRRRRTAATVTTVTARARTPDGGRFAGLLRAYTATRTPVYQGDEYCSACHDQHKTERWSGLAVYRQTAHSSMIPTPTSGTEIRCSACHESHGSSIAPLLRTQIKPPAGTATVAVSADDRALCLACHQDSRGTYAGDDAYALSSHALSSKVVSITSEWATATATRQVGECQACHAPMGRTDGAAGVIPRLAVDAGRALCERCHSVKGPAATDIASLSYPATAAADPELVAVYAPQVADASGGLVELYSRATTGTAPYALYGPRTFSGDELMGRAAAGDIDGNGKAELLVASRTNKTIEVWSDDGRGALTLDSGPGPLSVEDTADLVACAEVTPNGGTAEVVTVSKQSGQARVYRFSGGALTLVEGPFAVGTDPSSVAVGDVRGSDRPDVVVTAAGSDTFTILEGGDTVTSAGPFATGDGPTGASIGDVWPGGAKKEIVVLNAAAASGQVSLFDGLGNKLGGTDYSTNGPGSAVPAASAVANVLPGITSDGTSGDEIVVAMDGGANASGFDVLAQVEGGGLAAPEVHTTGVGYGTGSVTLADVDADGRIELLAGNGGKWATDGSAVAPSMQVWDSAADGQTILGAASATRWGGGTELAGGAPTIIAAEFGAIGPSRHDVAAGASSHVSTETKNFSRHVSCSDCHEVHEATPASAVAPDVYGALKGVWGVSVENVSKTEINVVEKQGVTYEYEVCFKCHSGWVDLNGERDISFDFNTQNESVHAVEQASASAQAKAGSFTDGSGFTSSSVLHCIDCHGEADAWQPKGPHTSSSAPLLNKPYAGELPSNTDLLCYRCHKFSVYADGSDDHDDTSSLFGSAASPKLHSVHVSSHGLSCSGCHVSHGSSDYTHLMRSGIGFADNGNGATCTNDCHTGTGTKSYTR